jgi:hemoglobin
MLDPAPGFRPSEDGKLFGRIGGQATVDRLVDSLYARFAADTAIRPLFGRDFTPGRERQKRFFAEWLGGPPRYSESAWGALHQHHEDLPITRPVAERWLGHLRSALSDTVPDAADAAMILQRAQAVALALVNHEGLVPSPGRGPGNSRHRSESLAAARRERARRRCRPMGA